MAVSRPLRTFAGGEGVNPAGAAAFTSPCSYRSVATSSKVGFLDKCLHWRTCYAARRLRGLFLGAVVSCRPRAWAAATSRIGHNRQIAFA